MLSNSIAANLPKEGFSTVNQETLPVKEDEIKLFDNSADVQSNDISTNSNDEEMSNCEVSLKEGVKLVGKGFVNKFKSIAQSFKEHPVKTLAIAGLTTAAIAALPLVGISSATGAAVMAIGFAGVSVAKTTKDVAEAVKDGKEGRNDELREDLENIGSDSADLAMSLPFVPKALKQVKRAVKFGPAVKLNTQGISNIKNAKDLNNKVMEFNKVNAGVEYETIANEMGFKVKPEIEFTTFKKAGKLGSYDPVLGKIQISKDLVDPKVMFSKERFIKYGFKTPSAASVMRHELEHFKQFSDIAQLKGTNALKNAYIEKTKNTLENGSTSGEFVRDVEFNSSFYDDVVKSRTNVDFNADDIARIEEYYKHYSSSTAGAEQMERFNKLVDEAGLTEYLNKPRDVFDSVTDFLSPEARQIKQIANEVFYKQNVLETEAFAAQAAFEKSVLKGRPDFTAANIQTQALTSDEQTANKIEEAICLGEPKSFSESTKELYESKMGWVVNPLMKFIYSLKNDD